VLGGFRRVKIDGNRIEFCLLGGGADPADGHLDEHEEMHVVGVGDATKRKRRRRRKRRRKRWRWWQRHPHPDGTLEVFAGVNCVLGCDVDFGGFLVHFLLCPLLTFRDFDFLLVGCFWVWVVCCCCCWWWWFFFCCCCQCQTA